MSTFYTQKIDFGQAAIHLKPLWPKRDRKIYDRGTSIYY